MRGPSLLRRPRNVRGPALLRRQILRQRPALRLRRARRFWATLRMRPSTRPGVTLRCGHVLSWRQGPRLTGVLQTCGRWAAQGCTLVSRMWATRARQPERAGGRVGRMFFGRRTPRTWGAGVPWSPGAPGPDVRRIPKAGPARVVGSWSGRWGLVHSASFPVAHWIQSVRMVCGLVRASS
jgi:hypothetical protein